MTHAVRALGLAVLSVAVLYAAGCGKSFGGIAIGPWQIIPPTPPLNATAVELTRYRLDAKKQRHDQQKLVIELADGRAALTDTDGRIYPQQIDRASLTKIREMIAAREHQIDAIKPPDKTPDAVRYDLVAYENAVPVGASAHWALPGKQPLPEHMQVFVDVFDIAHRYAHPLSDEIDLTP